MQSSHMSISTPPALKAWKLMSSGLVRYTTIVMRMKMIVEMKRTNSGHFVMS